LFEKIIENKTEKNISKNFVEIKNSAIFVYGFERENKSIIY
jgi:hypothetical protein